jgi:hypothetical protein
MVAKTIIVYLDENRVDRRGEENPIKFKINPNNKEREGEVVAEGGRGSRFGEGIHTNAQ